MSRQKVLVQQIQPEKNIYSILFKSKVVYTTFRLQSPLHIYIFHLFNNFQQLLYYIIFIITRMSKI